MSRDNGNSATESDVTSSERLDKVDDSPLDIAAQFKSLRNNSSHNQYSDGDF